MAPTVPIEFTGQKESRKYSLSQTMGKSRKYSKGLSSGFVSDSRHVVETIDESDAFGSSAQVEDEAIAIENSRAPKRKCISLNGCDNFGVGLQVLSVSKMTPSERKDLELKLKMELEQVRAIQKKISSVGTLSASSYSQSYNVGSRGASFENRPSQVSASKGKKRPNGTQAKKNNFGPAKPAAAVSTSNVALVKQCETLLNRLMSHQYAWIFNTPVDIVKLNIPDYFNVIKHPMDLGTVKSNIVTNKYRDLMDFAADVRLTFSNAMTYNPPENDVHFMASSLGKYFEVRWKGIEKKLPSTINVPSRVQMDTEASLSVPLSTNEQITTYDFYGQSDILRKPMTDEEKHKISLELESLSTDLPQSIITFLKEHSSSLGQNSEDEIEVDIYALSDDTLFTLRKLLDDCLLKQKTQVNAESFDLERQNESGIHNSSIEACKGNDPIDEDVDIVGGNDQPVSAYLPSEIDNDVCRRTKGDSSCTSSGNSGSSSSDSGSGGSSESESEDANAVGPSSITKEIIGDKTISDHPRVQLGDPENPTYSENEVGIIEPNFQPESVSLKTDTQQEVDSTPSERQVSPEKLYRAALLRNRFADTILKAQEKAFEKGDKLDPEKVRIERDELERRQKEEKARLQAEAKAAEEARRKAAREAAAEAKRKREQEREAARQALLKMEKTVEINGTTSLFMEDLEMLRASHEEDLPISEEQTSPDRLSGRLGSFKLQGSSNPLEQLGLYMKKEDGDFDDDEVEEEPQGSDPVNDEGEEPQGSEPVNDVEEGEID